MVTDPKRSSYPLTVLVESYYWSFKKLLSRVLIIQSSALVLVEEHFRNFVTKV